MYLTEIIYSCYSYWFPPTETANQDSKEDLSAKSTTSSIAEAIIDQSKETPPSPSLLQRVVNYVWSYFGSNGDEKERSVRNIAIAILKDEELIPPQFVRLNSEMLELASNLTNKLNSGTLLKTVIAEAGDNWVTLRPHILRDVASLSITGKKELIELLNSRNYLENLVELSIHDCDEVSNLSLISTLQTLNLQSCHQIRQLPPIRDLSRLTIVGCRSLRTMHYMPELRSLHIEQCDSLEILPNMQHLVSLEIKRCPKLPVFPSVEQLESLVLEDCGALIAIQDMPHLKTFIAKHCPNLDFSPSSSTRECIEFLGTPVSALLPNIQKLEIFEIESCPKLKILPYLAFLESLKMNNCAAIAVLENMPSLKSLEIKDCDGLTSILDMPNLDFLQVLNCSSLTRLFLKHVPLKVEIDKCSQLPEEGIDSDIRKHFHLEEWERSWMGLHLSYDRTEVRS